MMQGNAPNTFGAYQQHQDPEGNSIFGYAYQTETPKQTPTSHMGPSTQGKIIGNDLLNMLNSANASEFTA